MTELTGDKLPVDKTRKRLPANAFYAATAISTLLGGYVGLEAYMARNTPVTLPPRNPLPELPLVAPTERPGQIRGMLTTSDGVVDDFMNAVETGKISPQSEAGIHRSYFHGLMITVNGIDFKFIGTNPVGEDKAEWWFKGFDPKTKAEGWTQLTSTEKTGKNSEGQTIQVTSLMLGDEDILWFPATLKDLKAALQNTDTQDGIVLKPPAGSSPIPNYDASTGKGILIPLSKYENSDPYSAQNIFEAIEYRTGGALNLTPTPEPQTTASKEREVMVTARNNFVAMLDEMKTSENPSIANLPSWLYLLQSNNGGLVRVSKPIFDTAGNLILASYDPLTCGYDVQGNFGVIINSGVFDKRSVPMEYVATHLDMCLNFQKNIEKSIADYTSANPNSTKSDALDNDPQIIRDATSRAWFDATEKILIPNRKNIPELDSIYNRLIKIYDLSGGDITKWKELLTTPPATSGDLL